MPISCAFRPRIGAKLQRLYGARAPRLLERLEQLVGRREALRQRPPAADWDERTVWLITYGDQVREAGHTPLAALDRFLGDYRLDQLFSGLHLLPFFPYSSDDGFSVVDYLRVDPRLGSWEDVARLGGRFQLLFDFVLNHCSQQHPWFQAYLRGEPPYTEYFIEADPAADLSAIVRPRSTPLLTPFETARGRKYVWTTFSADQVDLNYADPDVLLEMLDILLAYVERGATTIRLDAIGFLWKRLGTSCMHLPETHVVVKLLRDLVDELAPGVKLLTETNVPHDENVSYFGEGDEAHLVYNFSLAPLLLDAFLQRDAQLLRRWLSELDPPGPGLALLNFTASHDGVGVRPLEGLAPPERFAALVERVRQLGGRISTRRTPSGDEAPYELNITWYSALDEPGGLDPRLHVRKFLTSQGVMLSLQGVPAVYFHSLTGAPNDLEGVRRTGQNRSINRRKFERGELEAMLQSEGRPREVLEGYRRLLEVRRTRRAFHPEAPQQVLDAGSPAVLAVLRGGQDGVAPVLVLANFSDRPQRVDLRRIGCDWAARDLLSGRPVEGRGEAALDAWRLLWLTEPA